MGTKGESKKTRLAAYLNEIQAERIDESVWQALQQRLAPVSESYLRKLVRAVGRPMAPIIEGVVQDSFDDLERTLAALQVEYEVSDPERKRAIRKSVITAKDHAFFALKRMQPEDERRESKEEMLLWMRTWLENPSVFSTWLTLRLTQGEVPPSLLRPLRPD
jgi:hypothetical protein